MGQLTSVVWPFEGREMAVKCNCGAVVVAFNRNGWIEFYHGRMCQVCYLATRPSWKARKRAKLRLNQVWFKLVWDQFMDATYAYGHHTLG